jgi:hypothetical protein
VTCSISFFSNETSCHEFDCIDQRVGICSALSKSMFLVAGCWLLGSFDYQVFDFAKPYRHPASQVLEAVSHPAREGGCSHFVYSGRIVKRDAEAAI